MISSRPRKIATERAAVKCNEWADVNCVIFVYSYQKCVKACQHIAKAKCIIHFERKRERKEKESRGENDYVDPLDVFVVTFKWECICVQELAPLLAILR